MTNTRRNIHQLLKRKQLYSALYAVYTVMLHDLMTVLRESAATRETAKITISVPPLIEEFREQRRLKREHKDYATKEPSSL
jgi:hypothetical protein